MSSVRWQGFMTSTHLLLLPILGHRAKYRGMEVGGGGWRVQGGEISWKEREVIAFRGSQYSRKHNPIQLTIKQDEKLSRPHPSKINQSKCMWDLISLWRQLTVRFPSVVRPKRLCEKLSSPFMFIKFSLLINIVVFKLLFRTQVVLQRWPETNPPQCPPLLRKSIQ